MPIYHDLAGVVLPADGPADAPVKPSDVKAAHLSPDFLVLSICCEPLIVAAPTSWAIPLARTEFYGRSCHRTIFPVAYVDYWRLCVQTITVGKGFIRAWASFDAGATWNSLGSNSLPSLNTSLTIGVQDSGWVPIAANVKANGGDAIIRLTGEGGDGVTTTAFGLITLHAR
jgi:hypothetical protein